MNMYLCYHYVPLLLLLLCYPNFGRKFKFEMQNAKCKMQKANVIGSALNPSLQRPCFTWKQKLQQIFNFKATERTFIFDVSEQSFFRNNKMTRKIG